MREPQRAFGYVLHARPYRETSLLIELLVQGGGRIGAIARGVRGARSAARKAALQPLQPLNLEFDRSGELARLRHAEPASTGLILRGDALMAAFYLNELCVRLLPRDAPVDGLFAQYALALARLERGDVAEALRHFEWQLLDVLGETPDLSADSAGDALDPASVYLLRPGQGAQRVPAGTARSVRGDALLALSSGAGLPVADAAALRACLRILIEPLLGSRPLRSWGLMSEIRSAAQASSLTPSE